LRPIFCGLGLGLDTAGLGLGLGLEVSVLNYFSRPPMYLPNPFHMVACLLLPVTQVTKIQNASVKAILSNETTGLCLGLGLETLVLTTRLERTQNRSFITKTPDLTERDFLIRMLYKDCCYTHCLKLRVFY